MTTFVQQKRDDDCVVACLAMWTGFAHGMIDGALKSLPGGGKCLFDAAALLRSIGTPARRTVYFFESEKAILDLPSFNRPGGMHACYWDGERLYDPNEGRPGKLVWTTDLLRHHRSWGGTITAVPLEDEPK